METGTRVPRHRHSEELKARVLQACVQPGASVAAVAQAHGLNANLVHKWRRGRGAPTLTPASPVRSAVTASAEFIPLWRCLRPRRGQRAAPCCAGGRHPHRMAPRCRRHRRELARQCRPAVRPLVAAMHGVLALVQIRLYSLARWRIWMRAWTCGEVAAAQWHQGLRAGPEVVGLGVWPMPVGMAGAMGQNGSSGSNSGGSWSGMSCSRQACCICGP